MRSFAIACLSTILLSPISVLATYGEYGHHPDYPQFSEETDYSTGADQAVSKASSQQTTNIARIAVTLEYHVSDVNYICDREEEACLEKNVCLKKSKSCKPKKICQEKKKKCFKEYKCFEESKVCHKKTTNRYGFRCGHKFYNQAQILAAAKAACKRIGKNSQRGTFPAIHTAYEFEKPGPYVEWPITRNDRLFNRLKKSKRRIVMTMDCAVVGAVVRNK
ncbi:hypothetical protein EPUL_005988, partial [Erysiphe pulchra]